MKELILENLNLFVFCKDKNSTYLYCNENFAEIAGVDSPQQIKGKSDYDLFWREQANFFREGDRLVLNGGTRINVPEIQIQPTKVASILVTKNILTNKNEDNIGVIGSFVDISGYSFKKNNGYFSKDGQRFFFEGIAGKDYFTKQEFFIFKCILLGWNIERISSCTLTSKKTIKSHIKKIQYKLQCNNKNEIAPRAIEMGLTYILDHRECYLSCINNRNS